MKKILILDDEPFILEFLGRALKGFSILKFNNPELALKFLTEEKVDIIVSDIQMPSLDGIKFAEQARLITNIPIILMSGNEFTVDHIQDCTYLKKPFLTRDIQELVIKLLE